MDDKMIKEAIEKLKRKKNMENKMIKEAIETIVEYSSIRMCSDCILHEICKGHWKECPEYWNIDFVEDEKNA